MAETEGLFEVLFDKLSSSNTDLKLEIIGTIDTLLRDQSKHLLSAPSFVLTSYRGSSKAVH